MVPMIQDEMTDRIIESVDRLARQRSAGKITVRDVLKDMGVTNRVFYNRFRNIDEVLDLIYQRMTRRIRESLTLPWNENDDFFDHVRKIAKQTLILSYSCKENLSQFVFENDSVNEANFAWWDQKIRALIRLGQTRGQIRGDIDIDMLSYSIWCFIRGFNADAIARNLSREDAVARFDYGFGILLDGIRAQNQMP